MWPLQSHPGIPALVPIFLVVQPTNIPLLYGPFEGYTIPAQFPLVFAIDRSRIRLLESVMLT